MFEIFTEYSIGYIKIHQLNNARYEVNQIYDNRKHLEIIEV